MTPPSYVSLSVARADHVAEVTLLGPGKGNRMGPDFWREMAPACDALDADESVRAIVLRGSGTIFSAGIDLTMMAGEHAQGIGGLASERRTLLSFIERAQDAITAVERCRKPVIAAIAGWCVGAGVDLITACDVRLCSSDAKFSVRETKLAIVAELGTLQRLPHIVGHGVARELALTGDDIDAARAHRIGLVNEIYEDHAQLFGAARAMALRMATNSPLAVQGTKQILNASVGRPIREGLREVALWNSAFLASSDLQEAYVAFAEKRAPTFTGK